MADLTVLIQRAREGEAAALGRLYELLYTDLRRVAHARLRHSEGLVLLDTTGLVHESYLRLVQLGQLQVSDRPHFMAYASRVMRSIIVDFARQHRAQRRGGGQLHVTLDTRAQAASDDATVIQVCEALQHLAQVSPRLVQVVEMRFFAGLEDVEIAQALGLSVRTVERDWVKARLFLAESLRQP